MNHYPFTCRSKSVASISTIEFGPNGVPIVNASGLDLSTIAGALGGLPMNDPTTRRIVDTLGGWSGAQRQRKPRLGGILDRDRYLTPVTHFEKIRTARDALRDDVIGGAADTTEALALSSCSLFSDDVDHQDVWNQWAAKIDLDSKLREFWRILYTDSQAVVALWWEQQTFKVRGVGDEGRQRRKRISILAPSAWSFIDSTKVVPVGSQMFNRGALAYIADADEAEMLDRVIEAREGMAPPKNSSGMPVRFSERSGGPTAPAAFDPEDDAVAARLIRRRYNPPEHERTRLTQHGIAWDNLFLLDSRMVFRHTLTKPDYDLFPDIRLEGAFPLLDLKAQLRQMDRAFLVGGAAYILVLTQGSDAHPGQQPEIDALKAGAAMLGSLPLLVGDHRLNLEIVTPPIEATINKAKWDTIDARLTSLAFRTFAAGGSDMDDPMKTGRIVARGLEGRRRMMRRSIEQNVLSPIFESSPELLTPAKLRFHPAQIHLAFDQGWANLLLDLREANELSRETMLSQLEFDQADEAIERERERKLYDDIFQTFVPHGANPNSGGDPEGELGSTRLAQRMGGRRRGGNRAGGGAAPGSGQGQESRDPRRSRERPANDLLMDMTRDELIAEAAQWGVQGRHQMKKQDLVDAISDAQNGTEDD